jgi:hypothetical protein
MTASVLAPQRWQSSSETAGISILPLILMYPSMAARAASGHGAKKVESSRMKSVQNLCSRFGERPSVRS